MANPLAGLARLAKALDLDDLVDLFHATTYAGHLRGARANPAFSKGANQGRGIYGYAGKKAEERARDHLDDLLEGKLVHAGASKPELKGARVSPGVFKYKVPRKELRLDAGNLAMLPNVSKDLLRKNEGAINDLLRKYKIKTRRDIGSTRLQSIDVDGGGGDKSLRVVMERFRKDGTPRPKPKFVELGSDADGKGFFDADDEELMGPILDLLRGVDRKGYQDLVDELLERAPRGVAFRTLTSPRMQQVS